MAKPLIILLQMEDAENLFEKKSRHLLTQLASRAEVRRARSASEARRYLTSTIRPRAVIVADAAVTYPQYRDILLLLVEYVKAGGTTVFTGRLYDASETRDPLMLDFMFSDAWGLPWRAFGRVYDQFHLYTHGAKVETKALAKKYSMTAVQLYDVPLSSVLYISSLRVHVLSKVKGPVRSPNGTEVTPAAYASVGRGRVGFIGDVNLEVPTTKVILAMCFAPGSYAPVPPGTGISPSARYIPSRATPTNEGLQVSNETQDKPTVVIATKRKIIILSLEKEPWIDELYTPLYSSLKKNAEMSEVLTVRAANVELSATPPPHAILVSDVAITRPKYGAILNRLIEYARAGGIVILGMQFSNHLRLDLARSFFARWDVPWDVGSYHRTTFALNPTGVPAPLSKDALQPSYSMKAVHLKNVSRASAVYLPTSTSRVESHVFAPTPITGERAEESPAVFGSVGRGYLGYVGDVNGEQGSLRLMIEMCGVRIQPGDMGARTFSSSVTMHPDGTTEAVNETEEEIPLPPVAVAPSVPPREPREREAEVVARAEQRAKTRQEKAKKADALKDEGNALFRAEKWMESAEKYREAALLAGPQPVYLANLAASLLKMERWELADSAATRALMHEPNHIKALYRRAQARRQMGRYAAAEADIQLLLSIDKTNRPALDELAAIQKRTDRPVRDWPGDKEYAKRGGLDTPLELEDESDSEDFTHAGNGTPCKFYNHGGCRHGKTCRFRHAPDSRSVRDELGRNVCAYWLLGECRHSDRCVYAHDKTYLPASKWWRDERRLSRMRKEFNDAVKAHPFPLAASEGARTGGHESMLPEALKPAPWRKDLWAVAPFEKSPDDEEDEDFEDEDDEDEWEDEDEEVDDGDEDAWFDEDELDERSMNMGFTEADVEEMLMYGIKPYDVDAYAELMGIRAALGEYDYY